MDKVNGMAVYLFVKRRKIAQQFQGGKKIKMSGAEDDQVGAKLPDIQGLLN